MVFILCYQEDFNEINARMIFVINSQQLFDNTLFLSGSLSEKQVQQINQMNNYPMDKSSPHKHVKLGQKNTQKLVQDQNYSNQIFYGILSNIESIGLFYQNRSHQYNNKMFKNYDRVDYSSKNIYQLRSQLQTNLHIFLTSIKVFQLENPKQKWTLPQNFNQQKSEQFLIDAYGFLENVDKVSQRLVKDVLNILRGQLHNLQFQKVNLSVQYTEQEQKKHKNDLLNHGIFATQQMEQRQAEVQNCQNVSELTAKTNSNSQSPFGQNHAHIQQGYHSESNNLHQNSPSFNNPNGGHYKEKAQQQPPMEIEKNQAQVEQQYYVFYDKYNAEKFSKPKGQLTNLKDKFDYCYIQDIIQLKQEKNSLLKCSFNYVVPFTLNKSSQQLNKQQVQDLRKMKL